MNTSHISGAIVSWGWASNYSRNQGSEYEEQEIKEENLQSDFTLRYFHVYLFSTILEDTITQLRIIEECNTELKIKKTLSDMPQMLAHKHHVEQPLVKDELDEIDPQRLGCVEYSLNKMKADRAYIIKVLQDTYLNLTKVSQFYNLSDYVTSIEDRYERYDFLIEEEAKNKLIHQDISRQLRQLRNHIKFVTLEKNNVIEGLKSSIQDAELNSATRSRYVSGMERTRAEQHKQVLMTKEAETAANIVVYKTKFEQEAHVHTEVELLFNIKIQETLEQIEQLMKKYETDMETIELKIRRKMNEHELAYERRIKLEETIEKNQLLLKTWVQFKEERETDRQYREKMFNSAITIQAWWRGLLVRNQLGPNKVVKKRGPPPIPKEKSKKKK